LVHCSECQISRAMAIKTIQPGMSGSTDEIIYQCTQCGAETLKFCRIGLCHLPTQEDPREVRINFPEAEAILAGGV
jgi:hypothetical protein